MVVRRPFWVRWIGYWLAFLAEFVGLIGLTFSAFLVRGDAR